VMVPDSTGVTAARDRASIDRSFMTEKPKRTTANELDEVLAAMRAAGATGQAPLSRPDGRGAGGEGTHWAGVRVFMGVGVGARVSSC
jgi:hypothetical protein